MARRITLVGALVLTAGILLGWLGKGFFGFGGDGFGTGDGSGQGGDATQVRVETPASTTAPPGTSAAPASNLVSTVPPAEITPDVVDALIDGETYLVRRQPGSDGALEPVSLDELIRRVRAAEGNSAGLRLRISRRGTALPVAEERLKQALLEADVPRTAVFWEEETAP